MQHFELAQIDHALEWHLRQLTTQLGYWPDVAQLLAAGASDDELAQAKQAIRDAGRELVETFGVAPWADRLEAKGNNLIVSRLATGAGSYAFSKPLTYEPVNEQDLSQGYTWLQLPDHPHHIRYEVRYISDDALMDREMTQLVLMAFGSRRYLRGVNDDLTKTPGGFWVVPVGDSVDLSSEKGLERLWRIEVRDVLVVPAVPLGHVPAAVDLSLHLQPEEPLAQEGQVPTVVEGVYLTPPLPKDDPGSDL